MMDGMVPSPGSRAQARASTVFVCFVQLYKTTTKKKKKKIRNNPILFRSSFHLLNEIPFSFFLSSSRFIKGDWRVGWNPPREKERKRFLIDAPSFEIKLPKKFVFATVVGGNWISAKTFELRALLRLPSYILSSFFS